MMRMLGIGILLMGMLSGCGFVVDQAEDLGPEQFEFVLRPGLGSGEEAEELLASLESEHFPMDDTGGTRTEVQHLASLSMPNGRLDVFTWTSGETVCEGHMISHARSASGGSGCGDPDPERRFGDQPIALSSSGSGGGQSDVFFLVAPEVVHLEAIATDGTLYRIKPFAGYGYLVWRTSHGRVEITAFDATGTALGSVVVDN